MKKPPFGARPDEAPQAQAACRAQPLSGVATLTSPARHSACALSRAWPRAKRRRSRSHIAPISERLRVHDRLHSVIGAAARHAIRADVFGGYKRSPRDQVILVTLAGTTVASEARSTHHRQSSVKRLLPPRARSAGPMAARRHNTTLRSDCPARAHVWGKQAERSEAVGGIPMRGRTYDPTTLSSEPSVEVSEPAAAPSWAS